jgi:predicted nucleic acid-binding protein
MADRVFVDTNILLYARDAGQRAKQRVAYAWIAALWRRRTGRLSFQVLQEFYITATKKLKPGLAVGQARRDVRNLMVWNPVPADAALLESAWLLEDRLGFSWWDAQIVAAARRANCGVLLSEDMQHGLNVDGTVIVNPFASDAPAPPQEAAK